jgi:hypothetical protein
MSHQTPSIWIMRPDGIVLYHYTDNEDDNVVQCDLFGGFISAINTIASQLDNSGIKSISIGSKQITIVKHDDLLFIAMHSTKDRPKEIAQGLDRMAVYFCKLYPAQVLQEWRGNLHQFDGFRGWSQ